MQTNHFTIGEPILKVRDINMKFDGKVVLRDVSFQIDDIIRPDVTQGQVFTILGKSGSGKTTLAKIIARLLEPTSGDVVVGPEEAHVTPGEVGFVFQNYILFEDRTVKGNLLKSAYQGAFRNDLTEGFNPKHIIERLIASMTGRKMLMEKVDQYLDLFELRDHLDKYPNQLSGGQRQRLAILSQVLCSSRYIIFDEPWSGLDPEMKEKTCALMEKTSQLNELQTLGIISHDIPSAIRVSDKLLVMGREADTENGGFKPGCTVFKPYDLAEHGLAWQGADVCRTPQFRELVDEIQYSWFPNL